MSENIGIYTIRTDRTSKDLLMKNLKENEISMGWGGGITDTDLDASKETFRENIVKVYKDITPRRIGNLARGLTEIKENDILMIPNLPEAGKFIVGVAEKDPYRHDKEDDSHLNHRIKLKEIYGLDGKLDMKNEKVSEWYAKLWGMRLPIYPNYHHHECIENLLEGLRTGKIKELEISELEEYLEKLHKKCIEEMKKELLKTAPHIGPLSFERICEKIMEFHGYKISSRNKYDRKGGDADLIASKEAASPFEREIERIYIQIKKHSIKIGKTDKKAIEQVWKIMEDEKNDMGCVMSLGEFDKEAKDYAEEKEIILIPGDEICRMLLQVISNFKS